MHISLKHRINKRPRITKLLYLIGRTNIRIHCKLVLIFLHHILFKLYFVKDKTIVQLVYAILPELTSNVIFSYHADYAAYGIPDAEHILAGHN